MLKIPLDTHSQGCGMEGDGIANLNDVWYCDDESQFPMLHAYILGCAFFDNNNEQGQYCSAAEQMIKLPPFSQCVYEKIPKCTVPESKYDIKRVLGHLREMSFYKIDTIGNENSKDRFDTQLSAYCEKSNCFENEFVSETIDILAEVCANRNYDAGAYPCKLLYDTLKHLRQSSLDEICPDNDCGNWISQAKIAISFFVGCQMDIASGFSDACQMNNCKQFVLLAKNRIPVPMEQIESIDDYIWRAQLIHTLKEFHYNCSQWDKELLVGDNLLQFLMINFNTEHFCSQHMCSNQHAQLRAAAFFSKMYNSNIVKKTAEEIAENYENLVEEREISTTFENFNYDIFRKELQKKAHEFANNFKRNFCPQEDGTHVCPSLKDGAYLAATLGEYCAHIEQNEKERICGQFKLILNSGLGSESTRCGPDPSIHVITENDWDCGSALNQFYAILAYSSAAKQVSSSKQYLDFREHVFGGYSTQFGCPTCGCGIKNNDYICDSDSDQALMILAYVKGCEELEDDRYCNATRRLVNNLECINKKESVCDNSVSHALVTLAMGEACRVIEKDKSGKYCDHFETLVKNMKKFCKISANNCHYPSDQLHLCNYYCQTEVEQALFILAQSKACFYLNGLDVETTYCQDLQNYGIVGLSDTEKKSHSIFNHSITMSEFMLHIAFGNLCSYFIEMDKDLSATKQFCQAFQYRLDRGGSFYLDTGSLHTCAGVEADANMDCKNSIVTGEAILAYTKGCELYPNKEYCDVIKKLQEGYVCDKKDCTYDRSKGLLVYALLEKDSILFPPSLTKDTRFAFLEPKNFKDNYVQSVTVDLEQECSPFSFIKKSPLVEKKNLECGTKCSHKNGVCDGKGTCITEKKQFNEPCECDGVCDKKMDLICSKTTHKCTYFSCGDKKCDHSKNECQTCTADCTLNDCRNNGRCDINMTENCLNALVDCPRPEKHYFCDPSDNRADPQGWVEVLCGDTVCDNLFGENQITCCLDCPCPESHRCDEETRACISFTCGNKKCDESTECKTELTCKKDCDVADCLGDGHCNKIIGETCENSPNDCKCDFEIILPPQMPVEIKDIRKGQIFEFTVRNTGTVAQNISLMLIIDSSNLKFADESWTVELEPKMEHSISTIASVDKEGEHEMMIMGLRESQKRPVQEQVTFVYKGKGFVERLLEDTPLRTLLDLKDLIEILLAVVMILFGFNQIIRKRQYSTYQQQQQMYGQQNPYPVRWNSKQYYWQYK